MIDRDELVARFHRSVVDALQQTRERPFDQPVTVAEIYKDLVPYSRARSLLGVDLNADYEHALIRFLAGESGRARIEPENARKELKEELTSPNPNVTIYRKFAACDVWISELPEDERDPWELSPPAAAGASGAEQQREPASGMPPRGDQAGAHGIADPAGRAAGKSAAVSASPGVGAPKPGAGATKKSSAAGSGAAASTGTWCHACGSELPRGHEPRYCPFCGIDLVRKSCSACGAGLEAGWKYCIECGKAARGA